MDEKYLHAAEPEGARSSLYLAKRDLNKVSVSGFGFAEFDLLRLKSQLSLCKDERLSREVLLNKLFDEGKSVSQNGFTLIFLPTPLPTAYPAQAAFSAPKRVFKASPDRNRIKRLLREAYRHHKLPLYEKLIARKIQLALLWVYKGKAIPSYEVVEQNVIALLNKVIGKV